MDKLANPEIVKVANTYFGWGFMLLPWLWVINIFLMLPVLRDRPELKKFILWKLIVGGVGALLWAGGLGVWLYIYLNNRISWGTRGDALSVVIPKGY